MIAVHLVGLFHGEGCDGIGDWPPHGITGKLRSLPRMLEAAWMVLGKPCWWLTLGLDMSTKKICLAARALSEEW